MYPSFDIRYNKHAHDLENEQMYISYILWEISLLHPPLNLWNASLWIAMSEFVFDLLTYEMLNLGRCYIQTVIPWKKSEYIFGIVNRRRHQRWSLPRSKFIYLICFVPISKNDRVTAIPWACFNSLFLNQQFKSNRCYFEHDQIKKSFIFLEKKVVTQEI